jgi:hypothetical protein
MTEVPPTLPGYFMIVKLDLGGERFDLRGESIIIERSFWFIPEVFDV